jgi:hypothetical protein
MDRNICIYCGSQEGFCHAHAVPRGFGTFKDQPSLDRVCEKCDHEIGKAEEQLIKCGPEALFRMILGIKGRSGKKSTSPFRRGHAGQEPIKMKFQYPDTNYEVLGEVIPGTKSFQPLPQIVVIDQDNKCEHIIINDKTLTSEQLQERIKVTGLKGQVKLWPFGFEGEDIRWINGIMDGLKNIEGNGNINVRPCDEKVTSISNFRVDAQHSRAIAKIGFHYFLNYTHRFTGEEDTFRPVKNFIRYGMGNSNTFVQSSNNTLIWDFKKGYQLKYYGHIVIGESASKKIKAYLQLFIGYDAEPPTYEIYLGENPLTILVAPERFGHYYSYYKPEDRHGFDGEIHALGTAVHILLP